MGQKANPIALRIQTTNRYLDHIWFSEYYYTRIFQQNLMLQKYIQSIVSQIQYSSPRFFIQNYSKNVTMNVFLCHSIKLRQLKAKSFQLQVLKKNIYKSTTVFKQYYYFKNISLVDEKHSLKGKGLQNFMFFKNTGALPFFFQTVLYKFLFKNFYFMDVKNLRKQFYVRFFLLSFHFFKLYDECYKKIINFHKIQRVQTYDLHKNLFTLCVDYLRVSFSVYNKKIKSIFLKKKYTIKTLQKFSIKTFSSNLSISIFFYATQCSKTKGSQEKNTSTKKSNTLLFFYPKMESKNSKLFVVKPYQNTHEFVKTEIVNFKKNKLQEINSTLLNTSLLSCSYVGSTTLEKTQIRSNEPLYGKNFYLKLNFIEMKVYIKQVYRYQYIEIFLKKNKFFLYDKMYTLFLYKKNKYTKNFRHLKKISEVIFLDTKKKSSITFFVLKKKWYISSLNLIKSCTLKMKNPSLLKIQEGCSVYKILSNSTKVVLRGTASLRKNISLLQECTFKGITKQLEEHKKKILPEKIIPNLLFLNHVECIISRKIKSYSQLVFYKTLYDYQSASFLAQEIIYFLEKKIPFRKIKNKYLKDLDCNPIIRGFRISCSGRVGGKSKKAQRAKIEFVKYGQTSLHIYSSKIDFSTKTALTPFGTIGVKVWICYF